MKEFCSRDMFFQSLETIHNTSNISAVMSQFISEESSVGRVTPKDGRLSTTGNGSTVAGYKAIQAPAPTFLPQPPISWTDVKEPSVSYSTTNNDAGSMSNHLKMLLKVQC